MKIYLMLFLVCAVFLVGCATVPEDPNRIAEINFYAEQNATKAQQEKGEFDAVANTAQACPKCLDSTDTLCAALATICATGVARELSSMAAQRVRANGQQSTLSQYVPPRTFLDRAEGWGAKLFGLAPFYYADRANSRSNDLQFRVAEVNANRETATVRAFSDFGVGAISEFGNTVRALPPTFAISDGGIYNSGTLTSIGGNYAGRDHIDIGRDSIDNSGIINRGNQNRFESPDNCFGAPAVVNGTTGATGTVGSAIAGTCRAGGQ